MSLFDDLSSLSEWTASGDSDLGLDEVVLPDDSDVSDVSTPPSP